ncbi:MAG TPA: hypothetical protein VMH00_03630 [Candidatus Limnocylindrales bacterium]|nr:hypothetical protein [Candidatus Limnocylindrales bacterium]
MLTKAVVFCVGISFLLAQTTVESRGPLTRQYRDGEKLAYLMKGVNESWRYEVEADGVVKEDADGTFFEEYRWVNFVSNGKRIKLPGATEDFRQQVSLDPNRPPRMPDLSRVDRKLIGPITDFLTFYVDLWLANKTGQLVHTGDHFYFKRGTPNSWADGNRVILGESSIDFDFTLTSINQSDKTATLLVRHVPPQKPEIKLPAEWMRAPVANTPNNHVEVDKTENGHYRAAVGKETFDVELKVSLDDGKILSGTMTNPVTLIERECEDAALTRCGGAKPHNILRRVEIALIR